MIRVLFVCSGNICRSPMAEAVFADLVDEAGLSDQITVDSAGTEAYHNGDPAHPRTMRILHERGISYHGRSRLLTREDLRKFDYVIGMETEHVEAALYYNRQVGNDKVKIARLLDYVPQMRDRDVPDPYYNGQYEKVYDLVLVGTQHLLAHIEKEHGLTSDN